MLRRTFLRSLICLAAAVGAWSATSIDVSSVNKVTATMAITTAEDTLTMTIAGGNTTRVVQIVSDQDWGIGTTTGAYSTKVPVAKNQPLTLKLQSSTQSFFVMASTTSGTLHFIVLDNQ